MLLSGLLALLALDLSPQTAARLQVAWTYHTRAVAPNARAAHIAAFEATPVLYNGLLYVITPFNQVIALYRVLETRHRVKTKVTPAKAATVTCTPPRVEAVGRPCSP